MNSQLYKLFGMAGAVTVLALPVGAQNPSCTTLAGNMVQNCSFERPSVTQTTYEFTNSVSNWQSSTGRFEQWYNGFNGFAARDGKAHLELDVHGSPSNTTIWQYINNTVVGQTYDVFFSVGHRVRNGQYSKVGLMIDGVQVYDTGELTDTDPGEYKWLDFTYSFEAKQTQTKLGFIALGKGNTYGDHLDNIGMTAAREFATVPEPGSLALVSAGLVGMLALARRRRKQHTA